MSLLLLGSGCRTALGSAVGAYDAGRYPEAVAILRQADPPPPDSDPRLIARHALYRGLAELAVGDARSADRWLRRAFAVTEAGPDALDEVEYGRLVTAWRCMGRMPSER